MGHIRPLGCVFDTPIVDRRCWWVNAWTASVWVFPLCAVILWSAAERDVCSSLSNSQISAWGALNSVRWVCHLLLKVISMILLWFWLFISPLSFSPSCPCLILSRYPLSSSPHRLLSLFKHITIKPLGRMPLDQMHPVARQLISSVSWCLRVITLRGKEGASVAVEALWDITREHLRWE